MRLMVLLVPAGRAGAYECSWIPRVGEILDLTEARPVEIRIAELESELLRVVQVIHTLGPESETHRVTVRVVPLIEVESNNSVV